MVTSPSPAAHSWSERLKGIPIACRRKAQTKKQFKGKPSTAAQAPLKPFPARATTTTAMRNPLNKPRRTKRTQPKTKNAAWFSFYRTTFLCRLASAFNVGFLLYIVVRRLRRPDAVFNHPQQADIIWHTDIFPLKYPFASPDIFNVPTDNPAHWCPCDARDAEGGGPYGFSQ